MNHGPVSPARPTPGARLLRSRGMEKPGAGRAAPVGLPRPPIRMAGNRRGARGAAAGLAVLLAGACNTRGGSAADGGLDQSPVDAPPLSDAVPMALALDFSATGCAAFDPVIARCDGTAPLTLTFTPIGSSALTRFLWTFGDNTSDSSERSPHHTYALPGSYRVTLVGLAPGVGSLQQSHAAYVNVATAAPGAWCDVDLQCADDLACWCGASRPCGPVLIRGLCSRACDVANGGAAVCPSSTVCADLSAGAGAGAGITPPLATPSPIWRRSLCLPACAVDSDCAPGLRCRDLLSAAPATGWTRACFAAYPLEIGARCGDASGQPVDADCASRLCADLGAYRRCAADCSTTPCPEGTGCARFGDGRRLCLATCASTSAGGGGGGTGSVDTAGAACDDDPLLACEAPGAGGALGFTITGGAGPPAGAQRYCAPKRCASSNDCGPAGTCPAGGGNCRRLAAP